MTKHAMSKVLLAAVLAMPGFARAQVVHAPGRPTPTPRLGSACGSPIGEMTPETAKAALAAAVEKADANARQLAEIPVEFARVTAAAPYGDEGGVICVKEDSLAGHIDALKRKAAFWTAVRDALLKERTRIKDEADTREQARTADEIVADGRASIRLYRDIRASDALAADVEKDIETLMKAVRAAHDRENDYEILARKTEIYRRLQTLKTPQ
jgi:hypothetical protein